MQIFDPEQGGIGIEAVIPSYSGPASMALRLKAEGDLISEIEAVVTYKGATPIFAPGGPFRDGSVRILDADDPAG